MLEFPKSTFVNRVIPKTKFYDNANLSPKQKQLFQDGIKRIVFLHKFSPETINITAKKWPEVEIFKIELKDINNFDSDLLRLIDTAIPYPILFIIEKNSLRKLAISFKEPNLRNINTAKVDTLFETDWNDRRIEELEFSGLSTDAIYASFLRQIAGDRLRVNEKPENKKTETIVSVSDKIKEDVDKMKEREKIVKQIEILTKKIKNEPSDAKRQELAEERYELKQLL